MIVAHFIDVGQGNMTLVEMPNGVIFLYDCNITDENAERVLNYLRAALRGRAISFFVNSHREADHMRGLKRLSRVFPIREICDNGLPGGTTDSIEYNEYMDVRRNAQQFTAAWNQVWQYGAGRVRIFNAANYSLQDDPNAQSIVMKIENLSPVTGAVLNSLMLTGDSDARTWREWIVPVYGDQLASSVLVGGHHGASTFFEPSSGEAPYTGHIERIRPVLTVVSTGPNTYGHPDPAALRLYERFSSGTTIGVTGVRTRRTDEHGNMRLTLHDDGGWWITWEPRAIPPPFDLASLGLSRLMNLGDILGQPRTLPPRLG
jgi:beta-lactamase superfamily II metal-dependent hydrolase